MVRSLRSLVVATVAAIATLTPPTVGVVVTGKEVSHLVKREGGKATWYYIGMGACGEMDYEPALIVALNQDMWNESGGGFPAPVCGSKLTIWAEGKMAVATVKDLCPQPGCQRGDLDMSIALFTIFAPQGTGQFPITWAWGDQSGGQQPQPQRNHNRNHNHNRKHLLKHLHKTLTHHPRPALPLPHRRPVIPQAPQPAVRHRVQQKRPRPRLPRPMFLHTPTTFSWLPPWPLSDWREWPISQQGEHERIIISWSKGVF
ncbi:hypothetical protein FRB91_008979 [Serendipita sp. 411]|nr:hypothetical protein FRB91_008979 [Serendipita sp. 411]